jgi:site-specific DNA-methyltransferase (adenine-specific)
MIKMLNMDCMEYMRTVPDKYFDLAVVDPQYGLGEHGGKNRSKAVRQKNGGSLMCVDGGYSKKNWDDEPPKPEYFEELLRVSKNQIIWGANYMPAKLTGGAIVWDKINDGSDQSGAEIAFCSLNNRVDVVRYMWRGMMQGEGIGSVKQQGNKALNEKRIHPTQKPVKLYQWLLQNYAKPEFKILDTHLGSGSSAIAAHYFGVAEFVGTELDEDYYKACCERFENATAQEALF